MMGNGVSEREVNTWVMVTSGNDKADVYIKELEGCPYTGGELGASVRDNIIWKSIETEYIAA